MISKCTCTCLCSSSELVDDFLYLSISSNNQYSPCIKMCFENKSLFYVSNQSLCAFLAVRLAGSLWITGCLCWNWLPSVLHTCTFFTQECPHGIYHFSYLFWVPDGWLCTACMAGLHQLSTNIYRVVTVCTITHSCSWSGWSIGRFGTDCHAKNALASPYYSLLIVLDLPDLPDLSDTLLPLLLLWVNIFAANSCSKQQISARHRA